MIEIYFDNVLIDGDAYEDIRTQYTLFNNAFFLGSTASNEFTINVNKSYVSNHPSEVKIVDDNTTYYLYVDAIAEDYWFYNYTLKDALVNLNFNYDASILIEQKKENEEETYLQDIFEDILTRANIETDYVLKNANIVITHYDNTVSARDYIRYIAELEAGFVRILPNGKLDIIPHKMASKLTQDSGEYEELILGERKFVTRVVYDNGAGLFWSFDINDDNDEEDEYIDGMTVYLDSSNPFIDSVNGETQVEYVFNQIKEFEFWTLDITATQLDTNIRAGDIITFEHDGNSYNTIAQYSGGFGGKWVGNYSLKLDSERVEETKIIGQSEKMKRIQTIVNRDSNRLDIQAQEVDDLKVATANLGISVEGIEARVEDLDGLVGDVADLTLKTDGLELRIEKLGGANLIIDSVGHYKNDVWVNMHESISNNDIFENTISKNAWKLMNRTAKQVVKQPSGTYTISARYKKLSTIPKVEFIINGVPHEVEATDWTDVSYTFTTTGNEITIEFRSDTDDACYLSDLMLNPQDVPFTWQPANGESILGNVRMGQDGIEVTGSTDNKVSLSEDGLRGYYEEDIVMRSTNSGMYTKEIEAEKGNIAELIIIDVGDQTWLSRR